MARRYNTAHITDDRKTYNKLYQREYRLKNPKPKKDNELHKYSIPIQDRCEGYDELWDMVYKQVLSTWNWVEVKSVDEIV